MRQIYLDKRVKLNYQVLDELEVGIQLQGWEVKSLKSGKFNLTKAYIEIAPDGQMWLRGAHISAWQGRGEFHSESAEYKSHRLLARRAQIAKLLVKAKQPGHTLVPVQMYVNDAGLIKMQVALVKGIKKYEKKQKVKERDMRRQYDQEIKSLR